MKSYLFNIVLRNFRAGYLLPFILLVFYFGLSPMFCLAQASVEQDVSNDNAPDYADQLFQIDSSAWKSSQFPLKVWISDGKGVQGYRDSYRQIFISALDTWQNAMQGKISWISCDSKDNADIVCTWVGSLAEVEEHGPTFGEYGNTSIGQIGLGDKAQNDQAEIFITTSGKVTTLPDDVMRGLCLHEIGHALGCKGHSPNRADVMYPSVNKTNRDELSARDKATMLKLYARNNRVLKDALPK